MFETWEYAIMDLLPVILYSHMDNLQREGILEAKSALAATKFIKLPPKRSAECGLVYMKRTVAVGRHG